MTVQCCLCLRAAIEPLPTSQLTGKCLVTSKAVDTLRQHQCMDFKVTHIHIFQSKGFRLLAGVAKKW